MQLVTSQQIAAIDKRTIEQHGIPGITLMHRAGQAVVSELLARVGSVSGERVIVLCGRGNNGGDGFVVARLLREQKAKVEVYLLAEQEKITGDAKLAMEEWLVAGGTITPLVDDEALLRAAGTWGGADYLIDGLLGTGLRGEAHGVMRTAIEAVDRLRVPLVAIDIPSGISSDTGQVCGVALRATLTVTFGLPKVGHAFYPGKRHCGTLCVADIGFPQEALEAEAGKTFMAGRDDACRWVPRREPDAHKGSVGRVLVVAGSVGMTGAAALSSETALRAGAGLVYLACPESLNDILEVKLTEVITIPLPEVRRKRCLALRAHGEVRRLAEDVNVVAIGPGLGRHRETTELVRRFVGECAKPLVIDADGLFALSPVSSLAGKSADGFRFGEGVVLTPHYGECARLLGVDIPDVRKDPVGTCQRAAKEWGLTLLLKGAPTVVCGPSGETWVNPTGNPGMASAGSGDVLTGLIAGFIAQGVEPEIAARLGAYVHGMAGDFARDELGVHGMIAGDILRHVPKTLKELAST